MRDFKDLQVWKEACLTSINVDDMDEIDEELFFLNKKCENINKLFLNVDDWMDPEIDNHLDEMTMDFDLIICND